MTPRQIRCTFTLAGREQEPVEYNYYWVCSIRYLNSRSCLTSARSIATSMRPVWTHHTPSIPPIAASIRVRASWTHYPSCLVRAPTWFWHPSCLPSTDRFSFSIPVVVVPSRTSPRSVAHRHRYRPQHPTGHVLLTCSADFFSQRCH